MINEELEKEKKMERIFTLVKNVWKADKKAKVRKICLVIGMSAEGKLYTTNDIMECINYFVEKGYLILNENGSIEQIGEEESKEDSEAKKFRKSLVCTHEQMENAKKEEEARKKEQQQTTGDHMKRNNQRKGRI